MSDGTSISLRCGANLLKLASASPQAFLPDIKLVSVIDEQPMNSIGSVPASSAAASKVFTVMVPLRLVTATGSMTKRSVSG